MNIKEEASKAVKEILKEAKLKEGDIFIVGCSTSEVVGGRIGKASSIDTAKELYEAISHELIQNGIFLAVQCCEHLNRAIVIEKNALKRDEEVVNVLPMEHAGGSLAKIAFENFQNPVVVEHIKADAGIDIGQTLIGMHLKDVVVPLRIDTKKIGEAIILGARTRPKFIGGSRAVYENHFK